MSVATRALEPLIKWAGEFFTKASHMASQGIDSLADWIERSSKQFGMYVDKWWFSIKEFFGPKLFVKAGLVLENSFLLLMANVMEVVGGLLDKVGLGGPLLRSAKTMRDAIEENRKAFEEAKEAEKDNLATDKEALAARLKLAEAELAAIKEAQRIKNQARDAANTARADSHRDEQTAAGNLATIKTASGKSAQVDARLAGRFQGLINDLEAQGYKINSLGGFNDRDVRGKPGVKSQHAHGYAIDINPATNPMGKNLVTDMPPNIRELAKKHGLGWGGDWKSSKDAMHFSAARHEGGAGMNWNSNTTTAAPAGKISMMPGQPGFDFKTASQEAMRRESLSKNGNITPKSDTSGTTSDVPLSSTNQESAVNPVANLNTSLDNMVALMREQITQQKNLVTAVKRLNGNVQTSVT